MPEEAEILSACRETCHHIFQRGSYFTEEIVSLLEMLPDEKKRKLLDHLKQYQAEIEKDPIVKKGSDQDKFLYLFYTVQWKENFLLNEANQFYPPLINIILKSVEHKGFHKSTPVLGRQALSPFMTYISILLRIKNTAEKSNFLEKLSKKR